MFDPYKTKRVEEIKRSLPNEPQEKLLTINHHSK